MDLLLGIFREMLPWMLLLGVPLALVVRGGWIATVFGSIGLLVSAAATFGLLATNHPDLPFILVSEVLAALVAVPAGMALRRRRQASNRKAAA